MKFEAAKAQFAFTLVEMMVVVVLIGILSAMIIPEMRGSLEDALLRSTSRELVMACDLAYSRAVTANQVHRLCLDTGRGRYFIEKGSRGAASKGEFVPLRDVSGAEGELDTRISVAIRQSVEDSEEAAPEETSPVSAPEPQALEPVEAIAFYPDGTAERKEIQLRDRSGFRLLLRINPVTARVRIIELARE